MGDVGAMLYQLFHHTNRILEEERSSLHKGSRHRENHAMARHIKAPVMACGGQANFAGSLYIYRKTYDLKSCWLTVITAIRQLCNNCDMTINPLFTLICP